MHPSGLANISKESSEGQSSTKMVSQPQEKQHIHQSLKLPELQSSQEWICAKKKEKIHNPPMAQQIPQQSFQKVSQPMQFPQNIGTQRGGVFPLEGSRTNLEIAGYIHSPRLVASDQRTNIYESSKVLPGNSSGSNGPMTQASSRDWHDQAYQEVLHFRQTHLAELIKAYKKHREVSPKGLNPEEMQKYEKIRKFLQNMLVFLQMSRVDFAKYPKEKIENQLKAMHWYINKCRSKHPSVPHPQSIQQPGNRLITRQVQQRGEESLQVNPPKQASRSTLVSEPQSASQQGYVTGLQTSDSSVNILHYGLMMLAQQPTFGRPEQANISVPPHILSQSELQQRVSSSLPYVSMGNVLQHSMNSSELVNPSTMDMAKALDSVMSPLPSNPTPSLPQLIQQQERYQMMQAQNMKQLMQQESFYGYKQKMLVQKLSEMPQQNHLNGQYTEHSPQRWDSPGTSQQHVPSPQLLEHPSPQGDLRHFLPALSMASSTSRPQHTETILPESNKQSHSEEQGFKRLIEAVKSISTKALCASKRGISDVIQGMDRVPGIVANAAGQGLVYDTGFYSPKSNFSSCYGTAAEKRMKRDITGYSSTFSFNKQKTEPIDLLLQEINKINEKLIETVLEVIIDSKDATAINGEGTIVNLSYRAVGHNLPDLPLKVLVIAGYPCSSPRILEAPPTSEEMKDLWDNARSKFSLSIRKYSEPLSLEDMAKSWDLSARQAFREFAEKLGGGCLSSKYGSWEDCIAS